MVRVLSNRADCAPERAGVPAEMTLPIRMADNHCGGAARLRLFRAEQAAQCRLHAENAKELRRHRGDVRVLGARAGGHRRRVIGIIRHGGESRALVMPVMKVRRRRLAVRAAFLPLRGERDHAIRVAIGERLQQYSVHHAEHRRIGADAERHHQHREESEPRVLAHRSEGELQIHMMTFSIYVANDKHCVWLGLRPGIRARCPLVGIEVAMPVHFAPRGRMVYLPED